MLNLLPPSEKKFLAKERQKKLFIVLCFELFVFLICILLVMLAVEFYILGELSSQEFLLQQSELENKMPEFSRFENMIKDYNDKLVLAESFLNKQKLTGGALNILLNIKRPAGVYFTKFSMQTHEQSGRVKTVINGFSDTRDNLTVFKNNIESIKEIENINFSPEAWLNPKNISFSLTIDIINEK